MAIQRFLETHGVFSIIEFESAFPASQTDRNLLSRAVASGAVDRVRRGLYVSNTGRYEGQTPNPLEIATHCAPDIVFAYTTALRLHGVLHNIVRETQFYVDCAVSTFAYQGHRYVPYQRRGQQMETMTRLTPSGESYPVTSEAQTLIDCLSRTRYAGGAENLLRSISGFGFIDIDALVRLARAASASTRAKLGWMLDAKAVQWGASQRDLDQLAAGLGGPYYFTSSRPPRDTHWVNRWHLYLPDDELAMIGWLNS